MQAAAAEYRIIDSSTDERCTAHECQRIVTSYARFTEDGRNASDAVGISYSGGVLNVSCTDYWASFQVRVHTTTGGDYPLQAVFSTYPAIREAFKKTREGYGWKYGLLLEELPPAAQAAFTALELRLEESQGITRAEIEVDGYDLIGRDCRLSFSDLVESGFSVSINKTSILIENVSGKAELWLDPIVTLENDTSVISQDTYVNDLSPYTSYGTASNIAASNITRSAIFMDYRHFNLTNASNAILYLQRIDTSNTGNFPILAQMFRCNQSVFTSTTLSASNWGTKLTDCEQDAIATATGPTVGDWFQFNITSSITSQVDGLITFTLNYTNSTANASNCDWWPWCRVTWGTLNHNNASKRPYLNITYYRNIGPNVTVTLLPLAPTEIDLLTCNYTYVDAEGDLENGSTFRWYKNGATITSQTGITLSPSFFSWGDTIQCRVWPRDGHSYGDWVFSAVTSISAKGGGGGGGTLIVVSPESQIQIDWGRSQYSFSVLTAPSIASKVFPITNRGQRNLQGSIRMLGNLSSYMTVEVCSFDVTTCSQNQVSLAAGETALLKLSGNFPRGWGPQTEGIVRLRDGFTDETSDLVVVADRPPLAFFDVAGAELGYVGFSQRFDLSEKAALFAYLAALSFIVLVLGGAAA